MEELFGGGYHGQKRWLQKEWGRKGGCRRSEERRKGGCRRSGERRKGGYRRSSIEKKVVAAEIVGKANPRYRKWEIQEKRGRMRVLA